MTANGYFGRGWANLRVFVEVDSVKGLGAKDKAIEADVPTVGDDKVEEMTNS